MLGTRLFGSSTDHEQLSPEGHAGGMCERVGQRSNAADTPARGVERVDVPARFPGAAAPRDQD